MDTKKYARVDMENKRSMFFMFGLIISLAIVLIAFEWRSPVKKVEVKESLRNVTPDEEYIPPTRAEEKVVAPPPVTAPVVEFVIVDNETKVDDNLEIFDSEANAKTSIDAPVYVPAAASVEEEAEENQPVFIIVEEMPEFPGGMKALTSYIAKTIKYPVIAQENGIQGKVYVSFVVDTKGRVTNAKVIRGVDPALDEEALRVVNSLPLWKPGRQGGKAVRVSFSVPISFVLQ
jgi:protein TonB